jgi:hypothetical protein
MARENHIDGNPNNDTLYHIKEAFGQAFGNSIMPFESITCLKFFRLVNDKGESILNYIIDDLSHHRITLSNPNGFNDITDHLLFTYIHCYEDEYLGKDKKWKELLLSFKDSFRIGCFCRDEDGEPSRVTNSLMWGHYTKNHTGICIKYRIHKRIIEKARTDDLFFVFNKVNYQKTALTLDNLSLFDALFTKAKLWEYENEYRLVCFPVSDSIQYFPIENVPIEAVYFGAKIEPENIKKLSAVLSSLGIPTYQMHFNPNNLQEVTPSLRTNH